MMRCPVCSGKMSALFTSVYCNACDNKDVSKPEAKYYYGYIVVPSQYVTSQADLIGLHDVFPTLEAISNCGIVHTLPIWTVVKVKSKIELTKVTSKYLVQENDFMDPAESTRIYVTPCEFPWAG